VLSKQGSGELRKLSDTAIILSSSTIAARSNGVNICAAKSKLAVSIPREFICNSQILSPICATVFPGSAVFSD
jgi:hypothetical protein